MFDNVDATGTQVYCQNVWQIATAGPEEIRDLEGHSHDLYEASGAKDHWG